MTDDKPHPDSTVGRDTQGEPRDRATHPRESGEPQPAGAADDLLFHELRVHQIELEMQNEELRRAQADLEASRARYLELYELAPVGYVTLDASDIVTEANLTAARLFGVTKDRLVGKPLTDFIHHDSQDAFYHKRRALSDSLEPLAFELVFLGGSGASFHAWVEIRDSSRSESTFSCRVAFTDISLLKHRERSGSGDAS